MTRRPAIIWTFFMDEQLRTLWPNHSGVSIGKVMGLPHYSVVLRAKKLGLTPHGEKRQPSAELWISAAREQAKDGVALKDILSGGPSRKVAKARWRAFKAVLDGNPCVSLYGLAQVSGFDHTTILHGLARLNGASPEEMKKNGKASGRYPGSLPAPVMEAAE